MFLLDSDILSLLHQGHPRIEQRIAQCGESEVATTVVSQAEILRSRCNFVLKAVDARQLMVAQHWLNSSLDLLSRLVVAQFDEAATAQFDKLRSQKRLRKIGRADVLIASIALANDATVVTRNLKDFVLVPGLRSTNWAD